jgi:hypothetical protein
MHKLHTALWSGGHKRKFVLLAILALTIASSAFAAWVFLTGTNGSAQGKIGTATTNAALTFTPQSNPAGHQIHAATPGDPGDLGFSLVNNSSGAETITSINSVITSSDPVNCPASNFSTNITTISNGTQSVVGWTLPGNASLMDWFPGALVVAANAPSACQNVDISVALTGNTTP